MTSIDTYKTIAVDVIKNLYPFTKPYDNYGMDIIDLEEAMRQLASRPDDFKVEALDLYVELVEKYSGLDTLEVVAFIRNADKDNSDVEKVALRLLDINKKVLRDLFNVFGEGARAAVDEIYHRRERMKKDKRFKVFANGVYLPKDMFENVEKLAVKLCVNFDNLVDIYKDHGRDVRKYLNKCEEDQ